MQVQRNIFKTYDIRGLVGSEVTPELAQALGKAFVTLLKKELPEGQLNVVVGRDMRESSFELQQALMRGLTESGTNVLDIGLISTPAFYFAVGHLKAQGGIMVSASHNPAKFNGFKMTRAQAIPVSGETGIMDLADIIERDSFVESDVQGLIETVEGLAKLSAEAEINYSTDGDVGSPKIVADSGNGMGAQYLDLLFEKFNLQATRMFWDFDGTFPNHEADPLKEANLEALKAKVKELGADLGIATDGDGDRIFFVDNQGEVVPPAIIRGILAQKMLAKYPGATIGFDIRPGRITEDMIMEAGGEPITMRVGHSLIKEKMREVGAVFGGESSGHFFYKFSTGVYEGPVVAAIQIMQALKASGKSMSDFITPLKKYWHSGEINFEVEDKVTAMQRIKDHFADGELNELDGISITYPDFWFNVRPSNTESVLRFALEAVDKPTMEKRRDEVKQIIEQA